MASEFLKPQSFRSDHCGQQCVIRFTTILPLSINGATTKRNTLTSFSCTTSSASSHCSETLKVYRRNSETNLGLKSSKHGISVVTADG
ncbi:hypothetical protein QQF64_021357 [Cirrhinus molitorella]|uniref:Uncharacterized protein n=1 Tax=Cirrhinus molitorella TaxID=172907 RepID=A0ABR3LBT3_9TELE